MKDQILKKMKIRQFARENMNYVDEQDKKNLERSNSQRENIQRESGQEKYNQHNIFTNIELLETVKRVEDEFPITSHRKMIGRILIFGKKLVRKCLRWYIHPIAEKQSIYNSYNLYLSSELKYYVEFLENKVLMHEQEMYNLKEKLNENLRERYPELVEKLRDELELEKNQVIIDFKLQNEELKYELFKELKKNKVINEEFKTGLLKEIDTDLKELKKIEGINEQIKTELLKEVYTVSDKIQETVKAHIEERVVAVKEELQNMYKEIKREQIENNEDETQKLRGYTDLVRKYNDEAALNEIINLNKNILKQNKKIKKKVIILCKNYKQNKNIEAIKKEANLLYSLLKKEDMYEVTFVSAEDRECITHTEDGVIYIYNENVSKELELLAPAVIHIFESNPHTLFRENMGLLKYNIVFTITGNNPLPQFNENAIEELIHLTDNNRLRFVVESEQTRQSLLSAGIKDGYKVLPIIDKPHIMDNEIEQFTIGFASSPMAKEEIEDRGVLFLAEVAKANQEIKFKIAWRNKKLEVPEILLQCKNVYIEYGYIDMDDFYNSINAIIIPYQSRNNNHACSLSAIEAISGGLPVITTEVAGVAEVVAELDRNCVADLDVVGVSKCIDYVKDNYDKVKVHFANKIGDSNNKTVALYKKLYESMVEKKVPILAEWDYALKVNNKYLVKGNEKIKKYYEEQSITSKYDRDRFIQYPMNIVNELEKTYVEEIINCEVQNTKALKLLDIATGTGRILEKLVGKGECTVIDNSTEMLSIILDKFKNEKKLVLLKDDFLEMEISDKFDVITSFRYIRHFDNKERKIIFNKIKNILNPGGLLIFDVPNLEAEVSLRNSLGWQNFNIYDVFWTEESIKQELAQYGFEVVHMIPIDGYYFKEVIAESKDVPMSFVLGARYKGE